MEPEAALVPAAGPASLVVVDPNGHRKRVPVEPIPFLIGRQPDNHLILRARRGSASRVVVYPTGHRKRVRVEPIPFLIGRQPDNHLILRDSRVSRSHARIVVENGVYVLEDLGDRKSTRLNSS